jgi:hypothetical protein
MNLRTSLFRAGPSTAFAIPLLSLFFVFTSCYGSSNAALPGSRFLWYAAEDRALVSFSRWDSLKPKPFGYRFQTSHVSSLAVVDQDFVAILSPWGKVSLSDPQAWHQQHFSPSPGLPGQQLGEYWIDSQGRFLHIFFEPGLSKPGEGGQFPLEIVKDEGLFGGWELIPFRYPPGEEGWQIVEIFRRSENQYLVILKKAEPEVLYRQMLWNSGTDSPEFLETEEEYTSLVRPYPEPEVLPSLVLENHSHLMRRTGAEYPVYHRLTDSPVKGLAYEFIDGLNRGILASNGGFLLSSSRPVGEDHFAHGTGFALP